VIRAVERIVQTAQIDVAIDPACRRIDAGDGAAALNALADDYDRRIRTSLTDGGTSRELCAAPAA